MVALVVVVTFVVLLLGVLVAGLLRSHADILRSLHELGVGVGDPASGSEPSSARDAAPRLPTWSETSTPSGPAPTVTGVTPAGDARAVAVNNTRRVHPPRISLVWLCNVRGLLGIASGSRVVGTTPRDEGGHCHKGAGP